MLFFLFRRMLRKAGKPAAMALVAGMLAISLTVTTTQKAEAAPVAVLPVIAAAESIVGGASLPLAMPSLLATSIALHPVGWAIGAGIVVAGLAILAYSTKDQWWPYVSGAFGAAKDITAPYTGGTTYKTRHSVVSYVKTGNMIKATFSHPQGGASGSWFAQVGVVGKCKKVSDGSIGYGSKSGYWSLSGTAAWTYSMDFTPCPVGYDLIGWKIGGGSASNSMMSDTVRTPSVNTDGSSASMDGSSNQYQYGTKNMISGGDWGTGAFDPRGSDVKYKTTSECISDDGTKSTITADWLGSDGGAKMPSCAAAGKGHGTGVNKIEGYAPTAPGVTGTVPETLWDTTAPAVDPNYSKCDQGRPGSGCKMAITLDGKPCVIGAWECENWMEIWKDPSTSARVGCTYGPYTLAVDLCTIMEPAYRPGGGPLTDANVDGDPSTRNNTDLNGQPFTPEKPSTVTVPGAAGSPAAGDAAAANCWPQGWAIFNPMWIYDSLNCAFVPKTDLQARLQNTVNTAAALPPMSWFAGVNMTAPGGANCPDWSIQVAGLDRNVVCDSSFTDALRGSRNLVFTMLSVAMVWPLIRSLWYAAIPFIRITPGSSK